MEGANALTTLGEIITALTGYMGEVINIIVSNPIMLITIGIGLFGGAIGLAKRLLG